MKRIVAFAAAFALVAGASQPGLAACPDWFAGLGNTLGSAATTYASASSDHTLNRNSTPAYFVDAVQGSDSNDGLSPNSAWKSIDRVNAARLKPGSGVFFRAGQTFPGRLTITSSGTSRAPITISRYGEGPKPVITGGLDRVDGPWSPVSRNVWKTNAPQDGGEAPGAVYFDGKLANKRSPGVEAVDQFGDWTWRNGVLYIYAPTHPANAFESLVLNVKRYGIDVRKAEDVIIEGLAVTHARQGVRLSGARSVKLLDLDVHDNTRDGIWIGDNSSGNLISGGRSWENGEYVKENGNLGHGVLITRRASNNTVEYMNLFRNAEDGVQFGPNAGSGNTILANQMWQNFEDGIDLKGGDQVIAGNRIWDNNTNGVLLHTKGGDIVLRNNDIRTRDDANALDVGKNSRVLSEGNRYQGAWSNAVEINKGAREGSIFRGDVIVDGGAKAGISIRIRGGKNHRFERIVSMMANEGHNVAVENGATATFRDSTFYTRSGEPIRQKGGSADIIESKFMATDAGRLKGCD